MDDCKNHLSLSLCMEMRLKLFASNGVFLHALRYELGTSDGNHTCLPKKWSDKGSYRSQYGFFHIYVDNML